MDQRAPFPFTPREVARLMGGEANGNNVLCPGPGHSAKDRSLSITITPRAPDGFTCNSFAGDSWEVCKDFAFEKLGLPKWRPDDSRAFNNLRRKAEQRRKPLDDLPPEENSAFYDGHLTRKGYVFTTAYPYEDDVGELLYEVLRYEHPSPEREQDRKKFAARRPGPDGQWLNGAGSRRVLYRASDRANFNHSICFVCEGEKDADRLASLGFLAVTVAFAKWTEECVQALAGYECFVMEDNDDAGRKRALKAAEALSGVAESVRIVRLDGLRIGGDVSNWLDDGGDERELLTLARRASPFGEQPQSQMAEDDPFPPVVFDPWDTFVVPSFPLDVLPESIRAFVSTQSRIVGCDPSAVAMSALCNFGAALDHRFSLKMMRNGSWTASPRLWVLLSGDPSRKKSPAINAATRDLEIYQNELVAEWKKACAEHKKAGLPEDQEPERPPRYVVGDTTTEKLGEILSRHDRGLLVKRDEFSGFIGSMERYGGKGSSADRAFWLQAFDGGSYTIDRIQRGETFVQNLSVSLIGGIQPDRLKELHGLTSDGLLQRFIPVMMTQPTFPEDMAGGAAQDEYRRLTRLFISKTPERLIMNDDALQVSQEIRRHLFDLEQAALGLAKGFTAFLGKLAGLSGSLALILHMLHDPREGQMRQVSRQTMIRVQRLVVEFIVPHALEFYRTAETTTDGDRLQKIASWILTAGKSRFVTSDIARNVAPFRGLGMHEIAKAMSPMVAGGWIAPDEPGPTPRAWQVNPRIFDQLKDRMEAEERRKQTMAELFKTPRTGKGRAA